MPPHESLEDEVAELDKRQSVHEARCEERYATIVKELGEMKTNATASVLAQGVEMRALTLTVQTLSNKMTEKAGSGKAVREIVAYIIAFLSFIAALYSGGLVHVGK